MIIYAEEFREKLVELDVDESGDYYRGILSDFCEFGEDDGDETHNPFFIGYCKETFEEKQ